MIKPPSVVCAKAEALLPSLSRLYVRDQFEQGEVSPDNLIKYSRFFPYLFYACLTLIWNVTLLGALHEITDEVPPSLLSQQLIMSNNLYHKVQELYQLMSQLQSFESHIHDQRRH